MVVLALALHEAHRSIVRPQLAKSSVIHLKISLWYLLTGQDVPATTRLQTGGFTDWKFPSEWWNEWILQRKWSGDIQIMAGVRIVGRSLGICELSRWASGFRASNEQPRYRRNLMVKENKPRLTSSPFLGTARPNKNPYSFSMKLPDFPPFQWTIVHGPENIEKHGQSEVGQPTKTTLLGAQTKLPNI